MLATTCSLTMMVAPHAAADDAPTITEERCVALAQAVTDATAKQRDAQDREQAAQNALDAAKRDVAKAKDSLAAVEGMVAQAESLLDAAVQDSVAKQAAVPAGVTVESAQQALAEAQERAAAARDALEASKATAQQQFKRGSLGFFESVGAQDAVAQLRTDFRFDEKDPVTGQTGYRIADDTHIGAPNDATHLDNMKAAIELLPESNHLRESDGQPALPVTDFLMAQAQVNINWSQQVPRGHSKNGWDNLAWGMDNPYDGWFHHERPIYFEALEKGKDPFIAGAGHYMAMVNPDMRATGLAMRTEVDTYRVAHAQTYSPKWEPLGTTFTVEEYTDRFNTYYDGLKRTMENGGASEREAVKQGEVGVETARQTLAAARALQAAQELVAQRERELAAAKEAQPARLAAAEEALASAEEVKQEAATAANAAQAAVTEAIANTEQAQAEYQPVQAQCATLTAPEEDGSSTGGIIAGVVIGLLAVIGIVISTNPGMLNMF